MFTRLLVFVLVILEALAAPTKSQRSDVSNKACDEKTAPNRSLIYCSGRLLDVVQRARLYADSKVFVDKPLKANRTAQSVLQAFERQFPDGDPVKKEALQAFVDANFDAEGHELLKCEVEDWAPNPQGLSGIVDSRLKSFANDLHKIWTLLCRKMDSQVKKEPSRFSLLYLPHEFIVPGGRFRETYYWDAYWICRGLLASGMTTTTKHMLLNLLYLVETYGFVPNGARVYYLRRSQPPLLTSMVYDYYEATGDKEFLIEHLPTLEKEYDFWAKNRNVTVRVDGKSVSVFQYRAGSAVPRFCLKLTRSHVHRPESYREDFESASHFKTDEAQREHLRNIASAAESGWDFSTRWFANKSTLDAIETTNIVPVDLNAFLCQNLRLFAFFYGQIGNKRKQTEWANAFVQFRDTFQSLFYVDKAAGWYDFNLRTQKHNIDFYTSTATPLYGWSPLNHIIIEGLRKSSNSRLQQKAFALAEKWVLTNLHVYEQSRSMWEKYDVVSTRSQFGTGGEYSVQSGFGWTNGVVLDLLRTYGNRMSVTKGRVR